MQKARRRIMALYKIAQQDVACYITVYPQQHWEYTKNDSLVILKRDNITLKIPEVEFRTRWIIIG